MNPIFSSETINIDNHIKEIKNIILKNDYSIILGTDSIGKSIVIPYILYKDHLRILFSTKNDERAIFLANIFYDTYNEPSSYGLDDKELLVLGGRMVKYATYSTIIRHLIKNRGLIKMLDFDYIMIEKAHENLFENIIIVLFWKYLVFLGHKVPRLVILSHYFPDFIKYIIENNIVTYNEKNIPIIDKINFISGIYTIYNRIHNINIIYDDNIYDFNDRSIIRKIFYVISDFHSSNIKGDFIVFLYNDNYRESLKKLISGNLYNINAIIGSKYISNDSRRKVYIINEDIYIFHSNISLVIDSMIEMKKSKNFANNSLNTFSYISKLKSRKRMESTGITINGIYYAMIKKEIYNNFNENEDNGLISFPLHKEILNFTEYNVFKNSHYINAIDKIIEFLLNPFQYKKDENINSKDLSYIKYNSLIIKKAYNKLKEEIKEVEYVLENRFSLVPIYNINRIYFIRKCPLRIRDSSVLYEWVVNNFIPYPCVVILSLINNFNSNIYSLESIYLNFESYRMVNQRKNKKSFNDIIGYSDIETLINIWLSYEKHKNVIKWSKKYNINYNFILNTIKTIKEVLSFIKQFNFRTIETNINKNDLINDIRKIFSSVYEDKILKAIDYKDKTSNLYIDSENNKYILSNDFNKMLGNRPKKIISILDSKFNSNRTINISIDLIK